MDKERDFKKLYEEIAHSEWFKRAYRDKSLGECPIVIPELEESEDERIRNEILVYIGAKKDIDLETHNRWCSYLEKQKDASEALEAAERIENYITEHTANSWEMDDSNPDKKYYCGVDDTLADIDVIVKDVYAKHKEQKPNIELIQRSWYMEGYHDREFGKEPKWVIKTGEGGPKHELNPNYGQFLAEQKPDDVTLYAVASDGSTIPIKQKPTEWSEDDKIVEGLLDFLENIWYTGRNAAFDRWDKADCANWMEWVRKQKEQNLELYYDKELDSAAREFYFSGGADSLVDSTGFVPIVRMAEFGATWMKKKMEKEQKPTEWSEEDEECLEEMIRDMEYCVTVFGASQPEYQRWLNLLKSLRHQPKWKSTEEEILSKLPDYTPTNLSPYIEQSQEWSDEECGRLFDIEHYLDGTLQLTPDRKIKCIDFIKSLLRPHPKWKPLETQMNALEHALDVVEEEWGFEDFELRSLFADLKKLL